MTPFKVTLSSAGDSLVVLPPLTLTRRAPTRCEKRARAQSVVQRAVKNRG